MKDNVWYLVSVPWRTPGEEHEEETHLQLHYIGLGGNNWPLNEIVPLPAIHAEYVHGRQYIDLSNGTGVFVCADLDVARRYFHETKSRFPKAWLIHLSEDHLDETIGFDIGNPEGGYSLIEAELTQLDASTKEEYLNGYGLFDTVESLERYVSRRQSRDDFEELEDIDDYLVVAVALDGVSK